MNTPDVSGTTRGRAPRDDAHDERGGRRCRAGTGRTGSGRSPWLFLLYVLLLSLPLWLLGALPGAGGAALPIDVPVSALQAFCPVVVAAVLVGRDGGRDDGRGGGRRAVGRLLLGTVDPRGLRPWPWLVVCCLLVPALLALTYPVLAVAGRVPAAPYVPVPTLAVLVLVFLLSAAGEEAGWSTYVLDPFRERYGTTVAALILGTYWAGWHVVGWYVQSHHTLQWTAGQFVGTVALRVLLVWLCLSAGRAGRAVPAAAVLCHASVNAGEFGFPNLGSAYDPVLLAVLLVLVAGVVVHRSPVFGRAPGHDPTRDDAQVGVGTKDQPG